MGRAHDLIAIYGVAARVTTATGTTRFPVDTAAQHLHWTDRPARTIQVEVAKRGRSAPETPNALATGGIASPLDTRPSSPTGELM